MANSYLQVRVNEEDKEKASQILDNLGTNLSTVVNMLIKQIILTQSIPFEIKMGQSQVVPMPVTASAASYTKAESSGHRMIEDPVIKGIREEYEGI